MIFFFKLLIICLPFQFRSQGERTLIFCEMPEMLELLRNYLHLHQVSFAYLDPHANIKERLTILEDFMIRRNFMALLTSPEAALQVSSWTLKVSKFQNEFKVKKILKGSLDLIPLPSSSVKIQINGQESLPDV